MNAQPHGMRTNGRIVAIGASAGGPQAIEKILSDLGADCPPIVITQHMPEIFTRAFARRLDELMLMQVKEAEDRDALIPGRVLIAPGDRHLKVKRIGAEFFATLLDAPTVNRHRPSVEVLFTSVVEAVPPAALGIMLTGMGNDGAHGLLAMKQHGYSTIAQDEASCVVWGMPREAVKLEAVDAKNVLPLNRIAQAIRNFAAHSH